MDPNPYRDWLAIEIAHETPNHYELLGLVPFTGDAAAARQAYEDRYAIVRRYEVGHYGDRASALMAELSDAFTCLTDEHQRSQYDQQLRETLAARETTTDANRSHDTLVDQIGELNEIVASELDADDPLGISAMPDAGELTSLPGSVASPYLPSVNQPIESDSKLQSAIPIWLPALCVVGVGIFVIGAMIVAFSMFGPRDSQDAVAQSSASASAAAVGESEPKSSTAASRDGVAGQIEWSGRLSRILIDEQGTLHLLVASADRLFEARSTDPELIQQLADSICLAENADSADEVQVGGTVVEGMISYFDPERRLSADQTSVAVLELQNVDLVRNRPSGDIGLSVEEKQTLMNLRTVGRYTQFVARVIPLPESTSRRYRALFHGRNFAVEIPAAWQGSGLGSPRGLPLVLVARSTGKYESPSSGAGMIDMLVLEVETINQPSFQQVVQSASPFVGQKLIYQATVHSTLLKEKAATLGLEVQNAGQHFSIKGAAGIGTDQIAFLEKLDGRDPLLAEFTVASADSQTNYNIVSLTHLNDPTNRVVFAAVAATRPEPMPLVERPAPKPVAKLAFAELPDYVDLPPLASQSSEPLLKAIEAAELEIRFASDLITLESSYGFIAKQIDGAQNPEWEIYLQKTLDAVTQEALVAHMAMKDEHLHFHWSEGASKLPAGQLRNCLMQLKSGSESHDIALRMPLRASKTSLPPEENKFQVTFDLEDLPSPESLRLDVEVSYSGNPIQSQARTNTTTRGKRLDFKIDALSDVEIQVALLSQHDKSLVLQAMPRHQLSANRQLALSTEEVNDHEQRIRQSGVKAERSLAKAQNMLATARSALARAQDSATQAKFGAIVETQGKAIVLNQRNIVEMQQALASIGQLRGLVASVSSNTSLRYRIYAEANETRLLLVDGGYTD